MQIILKNPFDTSTEMGRDRAANWDRQHRQPAAASIAPPAVTNPKEDRAQAIRETCELAGKPGLAAGFVASDKTPAEVASELRAGMTGGGTALSWKSVIAKIEGRA